MEYDTIQDQPKKTKQSTFAKKRFMDVNGVAGSIDNSDWLSFHDYPKNDDRFNLICSLFGMEAKEVCSHFVSLKRSLKGKFSGQEINTIERIFSAIARMDKEDYTVGRADLLDLARKAAFNNKYLHDFLEFVPQKEKRKIQ